MFLITMIYLPLPFVLTFVGTLVLTSFVYLKSLLKQKDVVPHLSYKDSALAKHLMKRCRGFSRPFRPPLWAHNRHIQTILAALMGGPLVEFDREYLQMRDRGVVALDWLRRSENNPKLQKNSPMLIVVPGLTGDAVSVGALCLEAFKKGYRVVVFNRRGHGGSVLTTPMLQSFGDPSDLRQVIKYLRGRYARARLTAAGISTGSELLMSYLGEFGSSAYLSAAVCVSPGYGVRRFSTEQKLDFYSQCLLLSLKRLLFSHSLALSKRVDIEVAMRAKTFSQFDEAVYCRLYGNHSLQTYWDKNNPMRDIDEVTVPLLCINSLDDPLCTNTHIPFELCTFYPNFFLAITQKGGHCGFIEDMSHGSWANTLVVEYLSAVLEFLTINGER